MVKKIRKLKRLRLTEDEELGKIVRARRHEQSKSIRVSLSDLMDK